MTGTAFNYDYKSKREIENRNSSFADDHNLTVSPADIAEILPPHVLDHRGLEATLQSYNDCDLHQCLRLSLQCLQPTAPIEVRFGSLILLMCSAGALEEWHTFLWAEEKLTPLAYFYPPAFENDSMKFLKIKCLAATESQDEALSKLKALVQRATIEMDSGKKDLRFYVDTCRVYHGILELTEEKNDEFLAVLGELEQRSMSINTFSFNCTIPYVVLSKFGMVLNFADLSVSMVSPDSQLMRALEFLAKKSTSAGVTKKELFEKLYGGRKYVPDLHDTVIRSLIKRIRKTYGVEILSKLGILFLSQKYLFA